MAIGYCTFKLILTNKENMSKISIVKNYWDAERGKSLLKILSHFSADAKFTSPTMQLNGIDEIKNFYVGMVNNYKKIEVIPKHWIEQEDEIAVEYDTILIRISGEERFAKGFNLFKIKEGLIESLHCYFNPADF
jgi:nuclear transport factor 2 (NTF2) superfamily protein